MGKGFKDLVALVLAALLIAGFVILAFGGFELPTPERLAEYLLGFGRWAWLVVIGLMILHSFVPFPAELLAVCAGAVFGTLLGAVLIWVGAMLGAVLAFVLSRALGRDVVRGWVPADKAILFDHWTTEKGALALLVARFIPLIAFNLINYAAGLTTVRLWTFLWTTGIGILPVTLLSTYLGAQMKAMEWSTVVLVSLGCMVGVWMLHRVIRRAP